MEGSGLDGRLLLSRPRPCRATVIRAIHHPPWDGGSLLRSDTPARSSIFHQPGERVAREQDRGRWRPKRPAHPRGRSLASQAPPTGSVHWLGHRPGLYRGVRGVGWAEEAQEE